MSFKSKPKPIRYNIKIEGKKRLKGFGFIFFLHLAFRKHTKNIKKTKTRADRRKTRVSDFAKIRLRIMPIIERIRIITKNGFPCLSSSFIWFERKIPRGKPEIAKITIIIVWAVFILFFRIVYLELLCALISIYALFFLLLLAYFSF